MDYNTNRKKLELPEYGRNVQNMVDIIKNTPDRAERNRLAKSTIQLMENMNPQLRDVVDYKHKLWDHLAVIADFDLDIDSPYPLPTQAEIHQKPSKMKYSNPDEIRFKHYGKILEDMVRKATQYPEGEERNALIAVIANQMKKSFLTWNRETVSDDVIFADLLAIACNRISIPEGLKLKDSRDLLRQQAIASTGAAANNSKKHKGKKQQAKKKQKTAAAKQ
ncbi:MAG: DUF4290 domain-containing protein [Salinivirgaceae bacterium]|nr:DUF4290 domain-containing protein [Salinivirgaceae bacterium]MBR3567128.1 DUF4290 domain-containing protein [Salinivirgaceae bacterium]